MPRETPLALLALVLAAGCSAPPVGLDGVAYRRAPRGEAVEEEGEENTAESTTNSNSNSPASTAGTNGDAGAAAADASRPTGTTTNDAGSPSVDAGGPVTTTVRFTALYTKYFGPTGRGQCNRAGCHNANVGGFNMGTTEQTAYNAFSARGYFTGAAGMDGLLSWAQGTMPGNRTGDGAPNATYMTEIRAWLAAGAPR